MYTKRIIDGYRERVMHYDDRLDYCPHGSCGKVYDRLCQITWLVSYSTDVAYVDRNGWAGCLGTYSATTRKHIGAFAKEYGVSYHDFKRAYENGEEFNIYTGEVRKIEF